MINFVKYLLLSLSLFTYCVFSEALLASEKTPVPTLVTGFVTYHYQDTEQGKIINGESLIMTYTKDGKSLQYPLDLKEKEDLVMALVRSTGREITLEGVLVDKMWMKLYSVPLLSDMKIGVYVEQTVLRVSEVRINYDKALLNTPKKDD